MSALTTALVGLLSLRPHTSRLASASPPVKNRDQIFYGVIVAGVSWAAFEMIGAAYFLLVGLLAANLWEAWRILTNQRPDVILTTGAGLAVPFALIAKLRRVPVVFVEISAFVEEPSLTGRIMHRLADRLFYQWEGLGRHFPRGTFGGSLL